MWLECKGARFHVKRAVPMLLGVMLPGRHTILSVHQYSPEGSDGPCTELAC